MNTRSINKKLSFIIAILAALILFVSGTGILTYADGNEPVGEPVREDEGSDEMSLLTSTLSVKSITVANMSDAQALVMTALANEGLYADELGVVEGWCADFVFSCAQAAGIGRAVIPYTGSPSGMYDALLANGAQEVSDPKAGDLVFYFNGGCYHVGIVINSEQAVNGNWGGSSNYDSYVAVAPIAYYEYMEPGVDYRFVRPVYADGSGGEVNDIPAENTPYDGGSGSAGDDSDNDNDTDVVDSFTIFDSVYLPDRADSDGNWYIHYKNTDKIAYDVTTVICNSYGWWYVEDGKVDFSYDGIAENPFGFWYIKGGNVKFDYYGVAQGKYGWWRIEGGKVNFDFTGLAPNEYGWWYLEDGLVDFTYDGLVPNEYGWWVVKGGQVRFDWWGIEPNPFGWWRIEGGQINFWFTGLAPNEYGWWYLEGGKVDFSYKGIVENEYGFWYVDEGKVQFDFNGIAKGRYGWWIVEGGQVNFDYTGTYTYNGKTYDIIEGKVQQSVDESDED